MVEEVDFFFFTCLFSLFNFPSLHYFIIFLFNFSFQFFICDISTPVPNETEKSSFSKTKRHSAVEASCIADKKTRCDKTTTKLAVTTTTKVCSSFVDCSCKDVQVME